MIPGGYPAFGWRLRFSPIRAKHFFLVLIVLYYYQFATFRTRDVFQLIE